MNGWQDESRHHPGRTTMAYAITTTESWGDTWTQWRQGVVTAIRNDFPEVLQDIGENDIDWDAWRPYYDKGHSPQEAVDQAFLKTVDA
jgi:hypothetical protein